MQQAHRSILICSYGPAEIEYRQRPLEFVRENWQMYRRLQRRGLTITEIASRCRHPQHAVVSWLVLLGESKDDSEGDPQK